MEEHCIVTFYTPKEIHSVFNKTNSAEEYKEVAEFLLMGV